MSTTRNMVQISTVSAPKTHSLTARFSPTMCCAGVSLLLLTLALDARPSQAQNAPASSVTLLESPDALITRLLAVPPPELVIHAGDLVSVRILEIDKFDYKIRVGTDGTINLPLVETVNLAGLRPDRASSLIAERLENDGMVKLPHVYVGLEEQPSLMVAVEGELQKPDVFPAATVRTLYAAISRAGGFKETANTTVTLIRPGALESYRIPLGTSPADARAGTIPVYAGDTIVVGKVGVIYVVGAVKLSGVYTLKNTSPTTAWQAVSQAGGMGYEADIKDACIVRKTAAGGYLEIPIDLRHEKKRAISESDLQADDIVYIPTNQLKAALKGGGSGVAVSLASAALYRY